jgi:hypothetical protein
MQSYAHLLIVTAATMTLHLLPTAANADDAAVELSIQLRASPAADQWQSASVDATDTHTMDVLSSEPAASLPGRQRAPELSEDQLVVVAVDDAGNEIYRQIIIDPRLVRGELTESGELGDRTEFYLDEVQFAVTLPDDPRITELRLFKPEWNGAEFLLNPLASSAVP